MKLFFYGLGAFIVFVLVLWWSGMIPSYEPYSALEWIILAGGTFVTLGLNLIVGIYQKIKRK